MAAHASPSSVATPAHRTRAQALVELALVMPLLLGIVTVLFQFGILFVAYLSIIHETRDIGRFVAVHPDTLDGGTAVCSLVPSNTLRNQVCTDTPSVINRDSVSPTFSPGCVALVNGHCTGRTTASMMQITLTYDASAIIFLPTTFRLGPWLNVDMPHGLPPYTYYVMVEQH